MAQRLYGGIFVYEVITALKLSGSAAACGIRLRVSTRVAMTQDIGNFVAGNTQIMQLGIAEFPQSTVAVLHVANKSAVS